jgi:hypothetical protein
MIAVKDLGLCREKPTKREPKLMQNLRSGLLVATPGSRNFAIIQYILPYKEFIPAFQIPG